MNYKRKRSRIKSDTVPQSCTGGSRVGYAPSHWNILFHHRPRRRRDKARCMQLMQGKVHPDALIWDLGNRKPHVYYW